MVEFQLNSDATGSTNGDTSEKNNTKAPKRPATTKASADSTTTAKIPKKANAKAKATNDDKSNEDAISDVKSIYEFVVKDTFGNDVPLAKYKGQVLLIVNIASRCGYTKKNYNELDELQKKYKNKGALDQIKSNGKKIIFHKNILTVL